jgi:hypothetical protein
MNNIFKILEFFNPEYLNVCICLSFNRLIKKTWVETKKIKGNISNTNEGEFKKDIYNM